MSEDKTFEQALKVAQADELAEKESKQLHPQTEPSSPTSQPVHVVYNSKKSKSSTTAKDLG